MALRFSTLKAEIRSSNYKKHISFKTIVCANDTYTKNIAWKGSKYKPVPIKNACYFTKNIDIIIDITFSLFNNE